MPFPLPLVVAGPSGVGKGTLLAKLRKAFPTAFGFSVSYTSRQPRLGEVEGVHYFFVSADRFQSLIEQRTFLEYANNYGNFYGTPRSELERIQRDGKICLLEVDVQGVKQIVDADINANLLFIAPPSLELVWSQEIERRLRKRHTETEEKIQARLNVAIAEIKACEELPFRHKLINDDLDKAYKELEEVILKWYPSLHRDVS